MSKYKKTVSFQIYISRSNDFNINYLICYDARDRGFTIEGNKEVTLEDKYMKGDV